MLSKPEIVPGLLEVVLLLFKLLSSIGYLSPFVLSRCQQGSCLWCQTALWCNREPESKHRSKSCIQWGQGRGTARNLVFLLASTKFTQTLFLFFREANGMFSGLPTLPTLKDLNHTLHGYLCVTAFAGFPSPYVWPWKPEKNKCRLPYFFHYGSHIYFHINWFRLLFHSE